MPWQLQERPGPQRGRLGPAGAPGALTTPPVAAQAAASALPPRAGIRYHRLTDSLPGGPHDMSRRTFTFLGTGTSAGVPMVGCECPVCRSPDPKNQRTRCSVLFRLPQGTILVDTPPELRLQLVRERVGIVHAVLFTHYHADHLMGLDDLRPIGRSLGHAVPLYCTGEVEG